MDAYYARGLENQPKRAWQELSAHLHGVARKASDFCDAFCSREWGFCAGLWHDLGKYSDEFQAKLAGAAISAEHSGVGAAVAMKKSHECGLPLAFAIAGHHAGLADLYNADNGFPKPLKERLKDNAQLAEKLSLVFPADILSLGVPELPHFLRSSNLDRYKVNRDRRRIEFWTRFLFSALVDADRLDSEEFCDREKTNRRASHVSIATLQARIDSHIDAIQSSLSEEAKNLPINQARQEIVNACREAARLPRGNFSLTVPTGGGKTLSSITFALRHALRNGLRRVIVVIPYTSIIEQSAQVYRHALGMDAVVEHHSNLDPKSRRATLGEEVVTREELASENWDAPVIVTTSVQFFESLFSNRPSRCRRLHNVAQSVVILDEIQTLPPRFLQSILEALNELVRAYKCSILLATATPPALKERAGFEFGLQECHEIVPNPQQLACDLQRVEYIWPASITHSLNPFHLAIELSQHQQVLAIVHRREDARLTAQSLKVQVGDKDSVYHLSALMCPSHRTDILAQVKLRLKQGLPCRLISTQLIEAGVDIDFPIVYRAMGGLDSIVQAGGRCNREGRHDRGRVVIFRAASQPPAGTPRRALEITEALLTQKGGTLNPADPQLCEDYFRRLYFAHDTDQHKVQTLRQEFCFASVARDFKLIEDGFTYSVVVPYADAAQRIEQLRSLGPSKDRLRALQVFTVNIYAEAFQKLLRAGALEQVLEGIWILSSAFRNVYDEKYGLAVGDEPIASAEAMIV